MITLFHKYIVPVILIVCMISVNVFVPRAQAYEVNDAPQTVVNSVSMVYNTISSIYTTYLKPIVEYIEQNAFVFLKMAALWTVQKVTELIIGTGNGGGSATIADFNIYLYVKPQQRAMAQMNSFFNTVSRNRLSSLNYEGVGPINYDKYLAQQARLAINGQPYVTNLQDQVLDPNQLFSSGNMKGITSYMSCANNVMCYTMTARERYNQEFAKAQDVARIEQSNGILPRKVNGKITQPAVLLQGALEQADKLGTDVIMNANSTNGFKAGIYQLAQGALISVAARSINYYSASPEGKEAIRNKNSQGYPFSIGYNNGVALNVGGVSLNTGVGSSVSQVQIGNTCATMGASVTGAGNASVEINGKKYACPSPGTQTSVRGPSVNVITPQ